MRAGDLLPGSRTLAQALGCHRNTVVEAYAQLQAEGWLEAAQGAGTRVAKALPKPRVASQEVPLALPSASWQPPRKAQAPPGLLELSHGSPDPRLLPAALIGRSYRSVLQRLGPELLDYHGAQGHPRWREALAELLRLRRGMAVGPEAICSTRGSQQGIYLAALSLLRPGDRVGVERLGYPPAWDAYRLAGAELVPIEVDQEGLNVAALAEAHARLGLRAVHLCPHHHYPTGVALSPARRLALLALAEAEHLAIVEDDYDHELHLEPSPLWPLASQDRAGRVLHVGSFSKTLAPALRLGFVAGPQAWVQAIARLRAVVDRQGDPAMEVAVAELLESGALGRQVAQARQAYRARKAGLLAALAKELPEALQVEPGQGGMALWATLRGGQDPAPWQAAAWQEGVAFQVQADYDLEGRPGPGLRLGHAHLPLARLEAGVAAMAQAWRRLQA